MWNAELIEGRRNCPGICVSSAMVARLRAGISAWISRIQSRTATSLPRRSLLCAYVVVVFFNFLWAWWDWVYLVRQPLIGLLYQPRMRDDDECGTVGEMRIGRGNRSTRRKPTPVPLCSPQIPFDLTWTRTRAAVMGSRRMCLCN
jgi:hypothetical protein